MLHNCAHDLGSPSSSSFAFVLSNLENRRFSNHKTVSCSLKDLLDLTSSLRKQLDQAEASNEILREQLRSKSLCASCEGPTSFRTAGTTFLMAILCFAVVWNGSGSRPPKFAPSPALGSPRPALPWIAVSCEVPEWRWSPERHFRVLRVDPEIESRELRAMNGPELMSIGDGES